MKNIKIDGHVLFIAYSAVRMNVSYTIQRTIRFDMFGWHKRRGERKREPFSDMVSYILFFFFLVMFLTEINKLGEFFSTRA